MNLLKNFPTLEGLIKASTAQSLTEYRGAMDGLIRPKTVYTGPTAKKLWSLKEQEEFYKNNPMYVMNLPVTSDTKSYEVVIINLDCEHMCSSNCRREGCNCACPGEWHVTHE